MGDWLKEFGEPKNDLRRGFARAGEVGHGVVAEQNHGMVRPTAETHAIGNSRNKVS